MLAAGLPVEPSGLIDVAKAEAWLENRRRNVEMRIPANTDQPSASSPEPPQQQSNTGGLSTQLLAAKVKREQASAALTLVKVGERRGELGPVAEFRAESKRAAEMVRESYHDFGRAAAVSIAGKFGLDLGEVQVHVTGLVRDHMRKLSANAKSEHEQASA